MTYIFLTVVLFVGFFLGRQFGRAELAHEIQTKINNGEIQIVEYEK